MATNFTFMNGDCDLIHSPDPAFTLAKIFDQVNGFNEFL
jgi:hypothetical protein